MKMIYLITQSLNPDTKNLTLPFGRVFLRKSSHSPVSCLYFQVKDFYRQNFYYYLPLNPPIVFLNFR